MKGILTTLLLAAAMPLAAQQTTWPSDAEMDKARQPAAMLEFAKVGPGTKVADLIPGNGYFTRKFAAAVGPQGKVIVVMPTDAEKAYADGAAKLKAMAAASGGAVGYVNSFDDPQLRDLDVVWTAQNYHDVHVYQTPADAAAFNKAVYAMLKPGGSFVVVDHAATDGSGLGATKTLHRIDPAAVKAEVTAAGFVFDGESKALRNAADPKAANVFDPAIRGKTDQFAYRFRKP